MWRRFVGGVAAVVVAFGLFGCAEIDRRGGLVDQIEDAILFRADTKSHRLLRSFVLVGALLAVARHQSGEVDRASIQGALETALIASSEGYQCLFPDEAPSQQRPEPWRCQFFDEKMARLDYAIYRLALVTLFDTESRSLLADVRNRLVGRVPVVGESIRALTHASAAVKEGATIINDVLQLSLRSFGPAVHLTPIYRDIMELDMWVIVDHLKLTCSGDARRPVSPAPPSYLTAPENACDTLRFARYILMEGNGNIRNWRDFIRQLNGEIQTIEAQKIHFDVVARWLGTSCEAVLKEKCAAIAAELEKQKRAKVLFSTDTSRKIGTVFTVSAPASTQLARTRGPKDASKSLAKPATEQRAPATTGVRNDVD